MVLELTRSERARETAWKTGFINTASTPMKAMEGI